MPSLNSTYPWPHGVWAVGQKVRRSYKYHAQLPYENTHGHLPGRTQHSSETPYIGEGGKGDQCRPTKARQFQNPSMFSKQCERNERASRRGTAIHFSGRKSESVFRGLQLQRPRDSPLLPHSRPGPETPHSFLHHSLLLHPHDCKRQQTLHGSFTAINHPDRQARMGRQAVGVKTLPLPEAQPSSLLSSSDSESLRALPTTLTGCPRQL